MNRRSDFMLEELGATGQNIPYLNLAAAALSLGTAIIHFIVMPEHSLEWWGYGAFFLVVGLAQASYAIGLLMPITWRPHHRWRIWYLSLGVIGNLLIIGLYSITRTAGIPVFGPEAGEVEAVGALDVTSKLLEAGLIGILAVQLVSAGRNQRHSA